MVTKAEKEVKEEDVKAVSVMETDAKNALSKKASTKKVTTKKNVLAKTTEDETVKNSRRKTTKKTTAKKTTKKKSARKKKFSEFEGKTLIIVESPAKAKTLEKILGKKYKVMASVGHVKDLPKGRIAVDFENNFEPEYIKVRGKAPLIKELQGASAAASKTLLASDPDREGEAISWHLANILGMETDSNCRIRMHEITKNAAEEAVSSPDKIDLDKVNAQQARRVLDRLVGYQLSPLLWYKVQRGLSAGRVQSVALRIICERENEIEKFVPEEYWLMDVDASSLDEKRIYTLKLDKYDNSVVRVTSEKQASEIAEEIKKSGIYVSEYKIKTTKRSPSAPYKTSTLQQDASRRCGFTPKRTMRIAQSLYEGIELPGRGAIGLITYMRTDSLRISDEAVKSVRSFIKNTYGDDFLSAKRRFYVAGDKAQDAHEAIRVTDVSITPDSIRDYLSREQFRLYDLIWRRFVASQMSDAEIAKTTLTCDAGRATLKQSGDVVKFAGWGDVYPLGMKDVSIPVAVKGEELKTVNINQEQKFTLPPARYTEARLVKDLEEKGIGRPSTYASIIDTLALRGYTDKDDDNKHLVPTKLGRIVATFLVKYFPQFINVDFTAQMEQSLDSVEAGNVDWHNVMASFWSKFKPLLDEVSATAEDMHPEPEKIGEKCPECGEELIVKHGRYGEFIACSGYPACKYTRKIVRTIGIKCPKCGKGELVRRRTTKGKAKGRFFYGCECYPECDYVTWKKPKKEDIEKTEGTDIEKQ